jgi:uncharacterized integral membrane protein
LTSTGTTGESDADISPKARGAIVKKYIDLALFYAALGLASGVFYREFSKYNHIEDSALGIVHGHILALGTGVFLIVLVLEKLFAISGTKAFRVFFATYNLGLPITLLMMFVRGILTDLNVALGRGLDASISGMAGIGHVLVGAGMVAFLLALRNSVGTRSKAK